jgi:hypothetical protein
MSEASIPQRINTVLEGTEEYQAPPREHEQETKNEQPSTGAGEQVDVSLLEAQQERHDPEMSETKPAAAEDWKSTVSGKDELADPDDPRATPPGERM